MTTTRRQFLLGVAAASALVVVAAPSAEAHPGKQRNLLRNGSFEQGPIDKGFKHWTVTQVPA